MTISIKQQAAELMARQIAEGEVTYTHYSVVEKDNCNAVHAHCSSLDSARKWIAVNAVEYCAKGYFMDKTLTPDSFMIIGRN